MTTTFSYYLRRKQVPARPTQPVRAAKIANNKMRLLAITKSRPGSRIRDFTIRQIERLANKMRVYVYSGKYVLTPRLLYQNVQIDADGVYAMVPTNLPYNLAADQLRTLVKYVKINSQH